MNDEDITTTEPEEEAPEDNQEEVTPEDETPEDETPEEEAPEEETPEDNQEEDPEEGYFLYQTEDGQIHEGQIINDPVDYSNYFENLQTLDILILGCLVAIGCIIAWSNAKNK